MNSSWILLTVLTSTFLFVCGIPLSTKRESISGPTKIFTDDGSENIEKELSNRQQSITLETNEKILNNKKIDKTDVFGENKKLNFNQTALEVKDLEESFVHPKDDDEDDDNDDDVNDKVDTILQKKNNTVSAKLMDQSIVKELTNEPLPPKIFPTDPLIVKSIGTFSPELRDKLNHEYKVTGFKEKNLPRMTSTPDVKTLVNIIEQTTLRTSIRRKTPTDERTFQLPETREKMVLEKENLDKLNLEKKGTHPGVVALLVAIVFAIFSAFGYVGLVIRKRYMEYKYGNRELLVNDFDSNDINNFEL